MRRALLALSLLLAACGSATSGTADGGSDGGSSGDGGPDLTAPFVGTWNGTTTLGDGRTGPGTVVLTRTGNNALALAEICGTGNVPALVTSATAFTLQATSCAPGTQASGTVICTVQYQVTSGGGTLNGAQLSLSVNGNVVNLDPTACPTLAASQPLDFTLVGTKQ